VEQMQTLVLLRRNVDGRRDFFAGHRGRSGGGLATRYNRFPYTWCQSAAPPTFALYFSGISNLRAASGPVGQPPGGTRSSFGALASVRTGAYHRDSVGSPLPGPEIRMFSAEAFSPYDFPSPS
jgi:hypothetical protein